MKHKRLKDHLKLGILLFGIFTIVLACQKEDTFIDETAQQNKFKLRLVSKSQYATNPSVNKIIAGLPNQTDLLLNSISPQAKMTYVKKYDFYIDNEKAYHITSGNYESYTFTITRPQNNGLVENMVLSKQADGSFDASIMSYDLTEAEKQSVINGVIPTNISNKTSVQPLEVSKSSIVPIGSTGIYLDIATGGCVKPQIDLFGETITYTWTSVNCPQYITDNDSGGGGNSNVGGSDNSGPSSGYGSGYDPTNGNGTGGDAGGNPNGTNNPYTGSNNRNNSPHTNADCLASNQNDECTNATAVLIPNDDQDCEDYVFGLTEIVNTPQIKTELNRLKFNMGFTAKEDGKRFIYTGSNPSDPSIYNDANFVEQLPIDSDGSSLDFPPLENKTLIGAHFHPDFDINANPIRKVPSGLDIAEHINMVKKVYATHPNAASQVTNFIVSKGNNGRTYILRVNNVQNIINNTKDYTKDEHRIDLHKDVYDLIMENYNTADFDGHETALANYLSENFPDLDLLKAEYDDNGNITKFCNLKTK